MNIYYVYIERGLTRVNFNLSGKWHRHLSLPALAFTRYCRCPNGMVCGIRRESRGGVVYCANVVQSYCNRVSNAGGRGNTRMID